MHTKYERSSGRKSAAECTAVQIPGTSHKLKLFWAGPYRVSKLIAPSLAEIKQVYYPREEKLVSLDVLKLYPGEDVVQQEPADVDPDR